MKRNGNATRAREKKTSIEHQWKTIKEKKRAAAKCNARQGI